MVETKPKTLFDMIRETFSKTKKPEEFKEEVAETEVVEEAEPEQAPEPTTINSMRPLYSPDRTRPKKRLSSNV